MKNGLFLALATLCVSCGGSGGGDVVVQFAAKIGAEDFACGQAYENLGTTNSTVEMTDFRFYVHDVALIDSEGTATPLELSDNNFQVDGTALLDFEEGDAHGCSEMGNTQTNTRVVGAVPQGDYVGLRFTMGVPAAINHREVGVAPAPLNLTAMYWAWNIGYKFARIEGHATGQPNWRIHLGDTGCDSADAVVPSTTCNNNNRVTVEFPVFDTNTDVVVADLAKLVEGANLDENFMMGDTPSAPGCMSGPTDEDCAAYFANLGLAFGEQAASTQQFFRVE